MSRSSNSENNSDARDAVPGNQPNWPEILSGHERWLRSVVLARTGEPQAVDEVWQEVSLAALKNGHQLRDSRKAAPWLYRVAVTQSVLYRRKMARSRRLGRQMPEGAEVETPAEPVKADPLNWLLHEERSKLVRQALNRLSPREAEILLLKYTENWSYARLAEHLGTTVSTIRGRLYRSRERLRAELEKLQITGD